MSALRTRSPRLSGYRSHRVRVAIVAPYVATLALLGAVHPPSIEAKTQKPQRASAKAPVGHQGHTKHRVIRTAQRGKPAKKSKRSTKSSKKKQPPRIARKVRPVRIAKRPPNPEHFVIPQGDGSPVLGFAARVLGRPYRFGSERGAFDCSGFVRWVFAKLGVELPHSARAQFALGERVRRDELEPGDLVFFHTSRRYATHVGIYVGEGKFVHAATRGGQVQVDSLKESYYTRRYLGARRLEI